MGYPRGIMEPIRRLLLIDSMEPKYVFALSYKLSPMAIQYNKGGPITRVPLVKANYELCGAVGGQGIYIFIGVTVD